jgi:prepilin-type processing-associated H-X9-DG protein
MFVGANMSGIAGSPRQYSAFTQLLPDLDQHPLYDSINFDAPLWDFFLFAPSGWFAGASFPGSNATCIGTSLALLLCPTDPAGSTGSPYGGTSYRANLGTDYGYAPRPNRAGPFSGPGMPRISAVADGVSQTAAFSERLRGRADPGAFDPASTLLTPAILDSDVDRMLEQCALQVPSNPAFTPYGGLTWVVGSLSQASYNHRLPPNARNPDCIIPITNPVLGHVSARSAHPDSVNLLMLDGSVRSVRHSIALAVWRALGTRAGGESVNAHDW